MSRISDLENKVDALERNVGVLAKYTGIEDWIKVGDYSSISHYNAGIKDAPEVKDEIPWKTICRVFEEVLRRFGVDTHVHYIHDTITVVQDTIPSKVVTFSVRDIDKIKS